MAMTGPPTVAQRAYALTLPTSEYRDDWRTAASMTLDFWERVGRAAAISTGFQALARTAHQQFSRAAQRIG